MALATHLTAPATLTIAALVGLGIALYHYFAPLTGVTGTSGALAAVASSALLMLFGLVLLLRRSGGTARVVRILALPGALGTLAAAWLLHEFWLLAAMAVALLAVVSDLRSAKGGR